jgi:hypothetical protein
MNGRRDRLDAGWFDEQRWWPLARSAGTAVVSLSVLGALGAALVASNQRVPGPTGWTYPELETWLDRQPVSAAFCLMSTVALIIVLYLMLSTVALLLARAARAARLPRLERAAETLAVPVIRRSLAALLGLGLTVAANSPPAHGLATPVMTERVVAGPAAAPLTADESMGGSATMRSVEPARPAATPPPGPPASPDEWTIRPGDHLWGLAETALATTWARGPSDAEVADYLQAIVELNRDVLVVPGHPDLVFPGQVFTRPAVPDR